MVDAKRCVLTPLSQVSEGTAPELPAAATTNPGTRYQCVSIARANSFRRVVSALAAAEKKTGIVANPLA